MLETKQIDAQSFKKDCRILQAAATRRIIHKFLKVVDKMLFAFADFSD